MLLEPAAGILLARFDTQKFFFSLAFASLLIVLTEHRVSMAAMDVLASASASSSTVVYFSPSQPENATDYRKTNSSEKGQSQTMMETTTFWPHSSRYNWKLSTEENYRLDPRSGDGFVGDFKDFRNRLDRNYHSRYVADREVLQDNIIRSFLRNGEETAGFPVPAGPNSSCPEISPASLADKNCSQDETNKQEDQRYGPSTNEQDKIVPTPWIVFTAGVYGAGKSHTIQKLQELGCFPPRSSFVGVDPDEIRRKLPEFSLYGPDKAGALTQKEAGMIAELITDIALSSGKNVVVDGSLRDAAWHESYFQSLRSRFGSTNNSSRQSLRIGILYVTAPTDEIYQRVEQRGVSTGRAIPHEFLERSMKEVPAAIERLKPKADFFLHVHNAQKKNETEVQKGEHNAPTFLVESTTSQTNNKEQDKNGYSWPKRSQPRMAERPNRLLNPRSQIERTIFQEKCASIAGYG